VDLGIVPEVLEGFASVLLQRSGVVPWSLKFDEQRAAAWHQEEPIGPPPVAAQFILRLGTPSLSRWRPPCFRSDSLSVASCSHLNVEFPVRLVVELPRVGCPLDEGPRHVPAEGRGPVVIGPVGFAFVGGISRIPIFQLGVEENRDATSSELKRGPSLGRKSGVTNCPATLKVYPSVVASRVIMNQSSLVNFPCLRASHASARARRCSPTVSPWRLASRSIR